MGAKSKKKIGDLLIEFGYITQNELEAAISEQEDMDQRLGEVLEKLGYVSEEELIDVLEYQLGIPRVNLNNYLLNAHLSQYVSENLARRHNAVPYEIEDDLLKVAMEDPTDLVAIENIEVNSGMKIEVAIATHSEIINAINQVYSLIDTDTSDIFDSLDQYGMNEEPELDQLRQMVEDAPIVRLTNLIITQAIHTKASDIHIEPLRGSVRVRYRVDGVLHEELTIPKHSQAALISRLKIIADLDITKRRIPQDGRIQMNFKGMQIDMRVSTLPTIYGEKVVIRLLNRDDSLLNIEKLGFSAENKERFNRLIKKPYGILLATGPTGSGKSTTLFAALNEINSPTKNIVTIEDPVEYQLNGLNQVHANKKVGLTFANTLRSILRQDPDIVMVGEIRDEETAEIAIRAALTGHLVLSTLHTNDAVSAVTRLMDMGIPGYLVASTVIGVIAQRLVRRLCPNCKEGYQPGPEVKQFLNNNVDQLYRPSQEKCESCTDGYKGRIAIHEILEIDTKLEEMITEGVNEPELKRYARENGMKGLLEDGKEKLRQGITSYNELVSVIH
ncbi:Type IV fimbrial assembly, ATPase PilB [Halanaerobium saccharolyticum subsp. saccharolyticum DSM 6643]|uniref:Type IV fimbrial assembly, ATPase PilB n=1 Tax=Halanaerobium saccharolyticum subsp. saccharolyticum DSM 6643 TaxID=1293054 RepID=M5DZX1_9FIRM|nr:GspE/PulE family protein [Halanaerobium saccharolyticum]CCU79395.1 Type IV fimbrial assembly, ATPase PilB [Halanaerobium saccharolyticum subsp. saccharolyticum DSM 6643]